MALSIISNFAANVAQRNLRVSDAGATASIAKLSSGLRVSSARDDAASLAIGSRLRAEVAALKTASVNTAQAGSLLQIADGALSTVADILVRLKELAVQASSGQFSSIERGVLDSEFQALSSEITRISQDTEFNGSKLIAGGASTATSSFGDDFTKSGNGFAISVDPTKVADNTAFRLNFDKVAAVAQVTSTTVAGVIAIGDVFNISVTDNAAGTTYNASFTATAATAANVTAGLTTALNNVVGITVTATDPGAGVVTLTAKTAGNGFTSSVSKTSTLGTISTPSTSISNVVGGEFLSVLNLTNGTKQTIDVAPIINGVSSAADGENLVLTETAKVSFASLGVDVTLNANFNRKVDHLTTGTITDGTAVFAAEVLTNDIDGGVRNDALKALLALGSSVYDKATGILTLTADSLSTTLLLSAAGIKLGVDGGALGATGAVTADLVTATSRTIQVGIATTGGDVVLGSFTTGAVNSTANNATGTVTLNIGELLFGADVVKGSSTQSFSFKVGSGSDTFDSLAFSVSAASASALGVLGTGQGGSIGITTAALADTASAAVSAAIDKLNQTRSDIGAAQNRLTFAASNLASAIENAEAARSGLLDLDVAAEISTFTSKQILVQTGVSALAQANQLPQNLLRLFQ